MVLFPPYFSYHREHRGHRGKRRPLAGGWEKEKRFRMNGTRYLFLVFARKSVSGTECLLPAGQGDGRDDPSRRRDGTVVLRPLDVRRRTPSEDAPSFPLRGSNDSIQGAARPGFRGGLPARPSHYPISIAISIRKRTRSRFLLVYAYVNENEKVPALFDRDARQVAQSSVSRRSPPGLPTRGETHSAPCRKSAPLL